MILTDPNADEYDIGLGLYESMEDYKTITEDYDGKAYPITLDRSVLEALIAGKVMANTVGIGLPLSCSIVQSKSMISGDRKDIFRMIHRS